MLTTILIILVVIIAAVLIYAATRPSDFVTSRTASIKAAPEAIFPLINDFKHWPEWSPYEKLDPQMKRTLSGTDAGKGRMEIVSSVPSSLVALKLDFEKPFHASNSVDFTLTPSGDTTAVSWAMRGSRPFIAKLMGLFMNFDTLIGRDFEAGLAKLKRAVEK